MLFSTELELDLQQQLARSVTPVSGSREAPARERAQRRGRNFRYRMPAALHASGIAALGLFGLGACSSVSTDRPAYDLPACQPSDTDGPGNARLASYAVPSGTRSATRSLPQSGGDFEPRPRPGTSRTIDGTGVAIFGAIFDELDGESQAGALSASGDAELRSFGVQVDTFQPGRGISIGLADRTYEDDAGVEADGLEGFLAIRGLLSESQDVVPYISARLRAGFGLDIEGVGGDESDPYLGYGLGFGMLFFPSDAVYLDLDARYEGLFGDIEFDAGKVDIDGVVVTIGVGIHF